MLGVILVIVWIAVVVHLLKKGEQIVCFNYITILRFPEELYLRILEKNVSPLVKSWIQKLKCSFCPRSGTLKAIQGYMEGCPASLHLFFALQECIQMHPLRCTLQGALVIWGSGLNDFGYLDPVQPLGELCFVLLAKSKTSLSVLDSSLCHQF